MGHAQSTLMSCRETEMTPQEIAKLPYRPNVGVMMINAMGEVFVAQRRDRFKEAWQMPQGGIDKGEDARVAALRELEEETGVTPDLVEVIAESDGWLPYDLPHDVVPKFWGGKYRGQEQKWFLLRYLGRDDQINLETEHPEFSAWCWQPVEQLVEKVVPFKREVYARVVEAFQGHL